MCEPLPLYADTSAAWAGAVAEGEDPDRAAAAEWVSGWDFPREDKEAEHVLVLGGALPLRDVLRVAGSPRDGEAGWAPPGSTRFAAYARPHLGCTARPRAAGGPMTVVAPDPRPFDACGELPTGMTLLQASAGTGKTFTIAALTTRYVAEGILPIDRLLVITFTRMATGELRSACASGWSAPSRAGGHHRGQGGREDDELVQLLARGTPDEVEARRDRLGKAIADFDAATIETTHGFCLQVLYGLGTAGDVDREVTLVEDVSDLREEVVDDLFLRALRAQAQRARFDRKEAMEIAKAVLDNPDADMVPPLSQVDDLPSIRRRFARAVRQEMEDRKKARKILTYDDVLSRLRATLFDEERGPAACARLRERYDVVLVDEFQDTDPIQWDIMRRAFGEGGGTLVLIGDPKQAIYAFRGADVQAYLQRGGRAVRMDPRRQLAQRPGAAGGVRRALRRCSARLGRHRLQEGQGRRRQPNSGWSGARSTCRCASACCTPRTASSR